MKLTLITFKTNHTIIGELVSDDDSVVKIKNPVQVVVQPTKDGNMMGFAPFVEFAEEFKTGIPIKHQDILFMTTPVRELENQYNQVFGVGIQIASAGALPKV